MKINGSFHFHHTFPVGHNYDFGISRKSGKQHKPAENLYAVLFCMRNDPKAQINPFHEDNYVVAVFPEEKEAENWRDEHYPEAGIIVTCKQVDEVTPVKKVLAEVRTELAATTEKVEIKKDELAALSKKFEAMEVARDAALAKVVELESAAND